MAWPIALSILAVSGATADPARPVPVPRLDGAASPRRAVWFDVGAGELGAALLAWERAAGLKLVAATDALDGRRTQGVRGLDEPDAALSKILAGTSLVHRFTDAETVAIYRADWTAAPGAAGTEVLLDQLSVEGDGPERANGPVRGYVATRSASGTKTDSSIVETPQSISVVPLQQIRDEGAQSLTDTLAYTPGVSANPGLGRTSDSFFIRGFNVATGNTGLLRDGLKLVSGVYDGTQEPYGLERVEVLKGAASILYGQLNPGGIINSVSKLPLLAAYNELNTTFGSYGRKEISGDVTGPLTADGEWSYRLTGLFRSSGTFIDFTPDDKRYIAPTVTWRPTTATTISLLGFYQEVNTKHQPPLPAAATLLNNAPFGRFPVNRFYGEPGFDRYDSRSGAIGYVIDHAFSDNVRLHHALRFYQAGVDWDYLMVPSLQANRQVVNRSISSRNENSTGIASDTFLETKFNTGPIGHTLLTGIDYYRSYLNSERYQTGTVGALNAYNPTYGLTAPRPNYAVNTGSKSIFNQVGIYAQDQIKLDRFVLLLGGRQDFAKTDILTYLTQTRLDQNDSAFSGRAGLVFLGDYGLAPFVSYSQSFATFAQTDRNGNPFQPTTGEQYEGGLRWAIPGMDTLISSSVFRINQKGALVPDPVNANFSIQAGEVRSQGAEVEARTNFGPLELVASYSYTDARTTQTTVSSLVGQRVAVVPYHLASAFGTYDLGLFGLRGLRLGGGIRYVGSANIPGYAYDSRAVTLLDFVASYDFAALNADLKGWRAQLNIRNLTDRIYVTCSAATACVYNEPRNVFGTISYRW